VSLRSRTKKFLYGRVPGFAGRFLYFGCRVYFPRQSVLFQAVCDQGVFEADNLAVLCGLAEAGTTVFDIGANIGLMAVPVLRTCPDVRVVSFEPSPSTITYLRRTAAGGGFGDRWIVVPKAAARAVGELEFHTSRAGDDAYEGLRSTGRAASAGTVRVPVTTLDTEWEALGRPRISVVKIDIEGAELDALRGATNLLAGCRPTVLMEWNAINHKVYGYVPADLLSFAVEHRYRIHTVPGLAAVRDPSVLRAAMATGETFLLVPLSPS
jgi:FkbM family methyltransferase